MEFENIISKLCEEQKYAVENYIPIIRDESARFLYEYVKSHKFKNVLEIGTAIGYSGSLILSADDQVKLVTIEINHASFDIAKRTFEKLNLTDRVEMYLEDAWNVLNELSQSSRKFDMIFLDGAKGQYIKYLDILIKILDKNGVIFADNVLLHGMVESTEKIPHKKRTMVVNLRKYLEKIMSDPFETEIIRIEDGIAITKIKGE